MRNIAASLLLILLGTSALTHAAPVLGPTDLTVKWTSHYGDVRSYYLEWTDRSSIETGFEVQAAVNTSPISWQTFATAPAATSPAPTVQGWILPLTTSASSLVFRVRSVNAGDRGDSNIVVVNHAAAVFQKPSGLTVTTVSDQALKLDWTDNSNSEDGVEIWGRWAGSTGNFIRIIDMYWDEPRTYTVDELAASTTYQFRIRAFRFVRNESTGEIIFDGNIPRKAYTSANEADTFTSIVSGKTANFSGAPPNFVATAVNETDVGFTWNDPFSNESGFELQFGYPTTEGATQFYPFWRDDENITSHVEPDWIPGTTYQYRVLAYSYADDTANNPANWAYSAPSNVQTVTVPFHKPTNLAASNITSSSATLTWTDNSLVETGYQILVRAVGDAQYDSWDVVAANQTSIALDGLPAGLNLEFAVRAFYEFGPQNDPDYTFSDLTPVIFATKDGFSSPPSPPATVGTAFSYQLATTTISPRSSWDATSLPPGLTFSSSTGQITGTPTIPGIYTCPITATFQNGWVANGNLIFRIVRPPAAPVYANLPSQILLQRGQLSGVGLNTIFQDPDAESAVRVNTTLGSFDMILYPSVTPQTVANFLNYVNGASDKNYTDSVFHRAVPGFVAQAGGFKSSTPATPYQLISQVTSASPQNEPGISNKRGTVAMAKLGGDPNSATSQFFVNVADNAANLDAQNGGFTVFARVAGSMTVPDAIANSPTTTRSVTINGSSTSLENFPTAGNPVGPIKINSVTPIPVLAYEVTGNSNPAVATATINGNSLDLSGLTGGTSVISYRVTDLDGNAQNHQVTVVVEQTSTDFLQLASLPAGKNGLTDDADSDGLTNFEEFAFMGSLTASDDATVRPKAITVNVNGVDHQAIQFKARKFAADVIYQVEVSGTLMPDSWTNVWNWQVNSTPPSASPNSAVINTPPRVDDMGDHYRITILDPTPATPGNPRFLRVKLIRVTPPAPTPA